MSNPLLDASSRAKAWIALQEVEPEEMAPGLWRQTLSHGPGLMLCLFTFEKGALLPEHAHTHEQAGYVISGQLHLRIGEQEVSLSPGMSYYVKSNERHSGQALTDATVLDAFSPAREDYIR